MTQWNELLRLLQLCSVLYYSVVFFRQQYRRGTANWFRISGNNQNNHWH